MKTLKAFWVVCLLVLLCVLVVAPALVKAFAAGIFVGFVVTILMLPFLIKVAFVGGSKPVEEEQGATITMDLTQCDCSRRKRLRRSQTAPPACEVISEGDILQLSNGQHGKVLPADSGGGSFFVPADSLQSFLKEREQP